MSASESKTAFHEEHVPVGLRITGKTGNMRPTSVSEPAPSRNLRKELFEKKVERMGGPAMLIASYKLDLLSIEEGD